MIQSITFWLVLLAAVAAFWLLPLRLRYLYLAVVSAAYLVSLDPVAVSTLFVWSMLFFYIAPLAYRSENRRGLMLTALVVAIFSYLTWFKAVPVILKDWHPQSAAAAVIPPLGISYFTFKLIHYAIETARGRITDRSLDKFLAYVFLFPIFTAGPIERYDHFLSNLAIRADGTMIATGLTRIAYGLIKVTIVARCVEPANLPDHFLLGATLSPETTTWQAWGFVVFSYLQEYVNFSAYSDVAIGASLLFGIRIMENFNFPVIATNISDFWRRWHMTLSGWCQTYIYMPVMARTRSVVLSTFSTFIAIGLWHGISFSWLAWGLLHSAAVVTYAYWARYASGWEWYRLARRNRYRFLGLPLTFAFVSATYAFSATDLGLAGDVRLFLLLFGVTHAL
jgi:alginate O-acetyltransferase complex protein AlgI